MKKQDFKKNEERLRNLWDNFEHSNIWIIGVLEKRRSARNWKLIWKHNEGELPLSGKGSRLPGSPGSSESPKEVGPKEAHPRHLIILPKIKGKERIFKAAREKETVAYKGAPVRLSADFSKETLQARRGWKEVFKVMKGKELHLRLLHPGKAII